jgi:threonine dehydratase
MKAPAPVLPDLSQIEAAATVVYRSMPATPQYRWPLLEQRAGCELWVKHENHTPIGAFKVRGGLVYVDGLVHSGSTPRGVICATRGNHGQSIAFAARAAGIPATVVVPRGNSLEKNAAMRALCAQLIEHGDDFQESLEFAQREAQERELQFVPSFHEALVRGVATYALEFFRGTPALDAVYAPVGLGSGLCGLLAAKHALGIATDIIMVAAENAPSYALSLASRTIVPAPARTIADGMSCRIPNAEAFGIFLREKPRVVMVSEEQIMHAMRAYFTDTHNVAEGAGAASLAAALHDPQRERYNRVGVVLTGGNIDSDLFRSIL